MQKMKNNVKVEGYLYEHDLQMRESGPNSKNPGTVFIMGNLQIATDDNLTNIVPVHFTYVTATTGSGAPNATFAVLEKIYNGTIGSVIKHGVEKAGKLSINTAIGLNEFYSDRNGVEELVSVKRNEGGFVSEVAQLNDEDKRNSFEIDILISGARVIEADPEKNTEEKGIVKGAIFNFRNEALPVEFSVVNPYAIAYFTSLEATSKNPVFTKLRGKQISEVVKKQTVIPGAFGEPYVQEVERTHKDWVITWAAQEPYVWDDEETITVKELEEAFQKRENTLALLKQRREEYLASKAAPVAAQGGMDFKF